MPRHPSRLIDLGALARRIGVAAAVVAIAAAVVSLATVDVAVQGLGRAVWAWSGMVLLGLGPVALALTAGSAIAGLQRARRQGEPLSDRAGLAPPQLRRR